MATLTAEPAAPPVPAPAAFRPWLAVLAILLGAALLRFWAIGDVPSGLQHDEAAYGIDARDVVGGLRAVFFERSNGREPLYIYLLAGSFSLFGVGVWQMHIVSAAVGLITVAAVYRLCLDLFSQRVALLAAAFVAFGYWPVHVSHTAFRAVTLPLLLTLAAIACWRAWTGGTLRWAILAGLLLAATMYTYLSNRMLPLLVVGWLLAFWWTRRGRLRWVGVTALVATLVFLPLGVYYLTHLDAFLLRSAQVNDFRPILLAGDFRPLLRDTAATIGMFVFRGDDSWKYNLSGRPVFDPISGILFLIGLGSVLAAARRQVAAAFLLIWLVVMIVPGAISGESPHFLRTIGALPVVFILPALGVDWIVRRTGDRWLPAAAVPGLVLFALLTANDLFLSWSRAPEQRAFFRADYATLARVLPAIPGPVTVAAEYPYDLDPSAFSLINGGWADVRWFDGQQSLLIPAAGGTIVTPAFARPAQLDARPTFDVLGLLGYQAPAVAPPARPLDQAVGRHLRLEGFDAPAQAAPGSTLRVPIHWRVTAGDAPGDISFSLKLVGPFETVWAQHDLSPAPPADWQPGDRLIVNHALAIDPAQAPGIYRLVGSVYRRDSVTPEAGGERIDLGTVEISGQGRLPEVRFPTDARFGDAVVLAGYEIDKPVAAAGESLGVTLYWRVLKGDLPDLTVFTHLIRDGEPTVLYGQRDSQPVYGAYPTTRWQPGQVIKDRYDITIDPNAPAGQYRIAVGLYDRASGVRLPASAPAPPWNDQVARLLGRLGLPYDFHRVEADRVLLRSNSIERR